ncbi:MAG: amidohydrolase family protein, partial [Synergistaceae bacterium]|nr:amidohydrolase family protein [Synergistaceae bacterium]
MDLVVRNARLRGESGTKDIAVRDGLVAAIGERLAVQAGREIDAGGNLASAPFIDPHLHLDAALSVGDPRYNESGTLLEGIAIWGERRPSLQKNEVLRNAREAVLWEVANGVQFIRTHADTTDSALVTVEALVELREEMKDVAEIQVVAFPQDGVFTFPEGEANLRRALDMGCDCVGAIPHIEFTREDGVRSVELAFELAEQYGRPVDIHCDETGDDQSRFVEVMAKLAIATGMGSAVTASHTTAMHNYNNDYALKLMGIFRRAKMNFITAPFDNSVLQNRTDGYPRRRGHTRVDELDAAGVNVSIGHDSIMDPWYPMGRGSMLAAANLLMHTAHMSGREQISRLFDMITDNSAVTMGVRDRYGV